MAMAFLKLLGIASKGNKEYLVDFLKKHELEIPPEKIDKIEQYIDEFTLVLNTSADKEQQNTRENVASVVYTFICSAIESTFSDYKIPLEKPMSWTKRKMRPHRKEASEKLEKYFDDAFNEIEELIEKAKVDLATKEEPKETDTIFKKLGDDQDAT